MAVSSPSSSTSCVLVHQLCRFGSTGPAALILAPDDIYISTLIGNLDGLNAGSTTTIDYAHMTWTRAHANASLQGNIDSGARIWWAYEVAAVTISDNPVTRV